MFYKLVCKSFYLDIIIYQPSQKHKHIYDSMINIDIFFIDIHKRFITDLSASRLSAQLNINLIRASI